MLLPHPAISRFLLRTFVRANGHAPAHRALSEFAIPAFTLRLHPQFIDTVCFAGEESALFLPLPVKEIKVKPLPASRWRIAYYSLVVKRWRQITKNAGRTRNARALELEVGVCFRKEYFRSLPHHSKGRANRKRGRGYSKRAIIGSDKKRKFEILKAICYNRIDFFEKPFGSAISHFLLPNIYFSTLSLWVCMICLTLRPLTSRRASVARLQERNKGGAYIDKGVYWGFVLTLWNSVKV